MESLNYKELLEIADASCKRLTNNFREHVCLTEAEYDLYDLIDAFHDLDSEFNLLLSDCYLAPLHESIELEPPYMEQYHRFFEQFDATVRALVKFFTKYSKNKASYKDKNFGLGPSIGEHFERAKNDYDEIVKSFAKDNSEYARTQIKYVNDTYAAYVYLLRGFNSLIELYNKTHLGSNLSMIPNVPNPKTLNEFSNADAKKFVLEFVKEIEALGKSIGDTYGKHQTGA